MSSAVGSEISPVKTRNPSQDVRRRHMDVLRSNAGEILSNSMVNNSFSMGQSPVKAVHQRQASDLPGKGRQDLDDSFSPMRTTA